MYRFCRNIDLGISHFNFSSKNQSSTVYTCFGKVVVLVTQSTKKLGLLFFDFSVILYGFYKVQLKHTKGCRSLLRTDPRIELEIHKYTPSLHKQPRKELQPCIAVLGPRGWRGRSDSGEAGGGDGRGKAGMGSRDHKGSI
jgi:hypothetical protein